MNKTIRISLWIVAIALVVSGVIAGSFYFREKSEMEKMYTNDTRQVAPGVYVVKDAFVNMFLVKDSNQYIAIDAGNNPATIRQELKKLKIDSASVAAVLLTHSDHDHTAALPMFNKAKVYLSVAEEQMINGTTARKLTSHNSLPVKEYQLLADGQVFTIGKIRIQCLSTPGHTPGAMSYLVNDSLLFVGDAFSLDKGKIARPSEVFTMDMETAVKSYEKIARLPKATYIFTSHSGYSCEYKHAVGEKLK